MCSSSMPEPTLREAIASLDRTLAIASSPQSDCYANSFGWWPGLSRRVAILFHYRVYSAKEPPMVYIARAIPVEIL